MPPNQMCCSHVVVAKILNIYRFFWLWQEHADVRHSVSVNVTNDNKPDALPVTQTTESNHWNVLENWSRLLVQTMYLDAQILLIFDS